MTTGPYKAVSSISYLAEIVDSRNEGGEVSYLHRSSFKVEFSREEDVVNCLRIWGISGSDTYIPTTILGMIVLIDDVIPIGHIRLTDRITGEVVLCEKYFLTHMT